MSGSTRADAIVVAAGRSTRMGGLDKLAERIGGRPLLAWAIDAVAAAPEVDRVVVVTTPERVGELARADWLPPSVTAVVAGGARRQESVRAGVRGLPPPREEDRVVLVHDGARPAVTPALVSAVAFAAARHGAAIPVVPVAETLKRVAGDLVAGTVERADLAAAQTPQGARRSVLERAWSIHPADGPATFTDEAALLEACRIPVHVIPGEPGNLKVTLPADIDRVRGILAARADRAAGPDGRRLRVGLGSDSHPFGPGEPLALGGIELAGAPRLHGHSDGDVVLHAVADALLGAAGLEDLGRFHPADDRTPRGVASTALLEDVVRRLRDAGYVPVGADVTIVAARPRLADLLDAMAGVVAELLGVEAASVGVKASTGNLAGMEGAGRGISAQAIVSVAVTE
ncbi:MAG TPA: 2-C-methyl-D-erythritol 2,4-cyclodiphosphate synthase [Candidatus Limnocylindrales bacterium]|nr:2-C-methyl-D-erythritol 2,4-cyclodiphosphate synthase [Candidatus Limnocylindrales bacterium]